MTVETELIIQYVEQLTPQQQKVLAIAQEHLGSSFNMTKSIGFKQWLINQERAQKKAQGTETKS